MSSILQNRKEAGQKLAAALSSYKDRKDTLVLALPRGGVPVAFEVAKALSLPLDILLVRKLGAPGQEELAIGAITWNDVSYMNSELIDQLHISEAAIRKVIKKEKTELERRNKSYRNDRPMPKIKGKTIIVIDDGLATGATMHAAVSALRRENAGYIIVAVPVGAGESCDELKKNADEVICLYTPEPFYGVGQWYHNFLQTRDDEVQELLAEAVLRNDKNIM